MSWITRSSPAARKIRAGYDLVGVYDVEHVVPGVRRRGVTTGVEASDGATRHRHRHPQRRRRVEVELSPKEVVAGHCVGEHLT